MRSSGRCRNFRSHTRRVVSRAGRVERALRASLRSCRVVQPGPRYSRQDPAHDRERRRHRFGHHRSGHHHAVPGQRRRSRHRRPRLQRQHPSINMAARACDGADNTATASRRSRALCPMPMRDSSRRPVHHALDCDDTEPCQSAKLGQAVPTTTQRRNRRRDRLSSNACLRGLWKCLIVRARHVGGAAEPVSRAPDCRFRDCDGRSD